MMATTRFRCRHGRGRDYWAPSGGGYVHDVTDAPGSLGPQVCARMRSMGYTLCVGPGDSAQLRARLIPEVAAARRDAIRDAEGYGDPCWLNCDSRSDDQRDEVLAAASE